MEISVLIATVVALIFKLLVSVLQNLSVNKCSNDVKINKNIITTTLKNIRYIFSYERKTTSSINLCFVCIILLIIYLIYTQLNKN